MYVAWLTFGNSFKGVYFPEQQNWNSQMVLRQEETNWKCDVYISVRAFDGRMYIAPIAPLAWKNGGRQEFEVRGNQARFDMRDTITGGNIFILIKQCKKEWLIFNKYRLPLRRKIVIGRQNADIPDSNDLISLEHGYMGMTEDGYVKYQDNSSNGTYLNGNKLPSNTAARLNIGDVLTFPTGLKIVYLGDCIAVNQTEGTGRIKLEPWTSPVEKFTSDTVTSEQPSIYLEYQRSPRRLNKSHAEDVEIEAPLAKQNTHQQPLFLQIGPSMTMILPMLMGSVLAGNGGNLLSSGLVMMSTSSALAIMWGLINRQYRKKQETNIENRRTNMYEIYIKEMEEKLLHMYSDEYKRLMADFPNVGACANMPEKRSQQLWNRMPTHPDFLQVRIGTGDVPIPCEIKVPQQKLSFIDDALRDEPQRLKETYSVLKNAPVTISLRNESIIGILGEREAALFAQGMLMQITALHSYHDVRIAVLTDESSASQWSWVRWLPHIFSNEDRDLRMFAYTSNDIHDVATHLDEVLAMRKSLSENTQDSNEGNDKNTLPLPHYIVFCNNYKVIENEPLMRRLLTTHLGMTLIMLGKEVTHLPKECHVQLDMRKSDRYMYTSEGDSWKVDFEYPENSLIKGFAHSMAPLRVRDMTENAAIPSLVSFLDIYNVRKVEDLEVWRMWTENQTYDGLKSVIGYRAGSQPFVLDISEKYHGPHGMIAGTTGSGKSVMLETYILSLALNYSPKRINFILIDYKGGGMADSFANLPHVVGTIDNLQGEKIIGRALKSLSGEIERREALFKYYHVKSIDEYNRQYGDIPGMELAHLIIIVDEFAELKHDKPDFMNELTSAYRVGRSLGIHLILSTQKPGNSVSDEMRANTKFYLCLRVQTPGDSNEMLRRPDAAYIKNTGRCFLKIGTDELFEQIQTSYSGLPYKPDEPRVEERPQLLTTTGQVVRLKKPKKNQVKAQKDKYGKIIPLSEEKKEDTEMTAVLRRIQEVAQKHDIAKSHRLWLPGLPKRIYLQDLEMFCKVAWDGQSYPNPQGDLIVPIGVADDIVNQRYLPFTVNLSERHNLMIAGMGQSGKTTLIQTMVYSLCSLYDPEHIGIYILSLTSRTLGALKAFPQVADVVFADEQAEIKRFLKMINDEMNRRSELFEKAATDNFVEYNKGCIRKGLQPEPAIVIFIDRYAQFKEVVEEDTIKQLVQEGSGRGIHLVVTTTMNNEISSKIRPYFSGIVLEQNDKSDYKECLGVPKLDNETVAMLETTPGRGLGVLDGNIYEVQFALSGSAPIHIGDTFASLTNVNQYEITSPFESGKELSDMERVELIVEYAQQLDKNWNGGRAMEIPRIPQKPTWSMFSRASNFTNIQRRAFTIPVGYNMADASLATIDTTDSPGWLVYGRRQSGCTNFLKLMARVMKNRGAKVFVIGDDSWNSITEELNIPLYNTAQRINEFINLIFDEYITSSRKPLREIAEGKGTLALRQQAMEFEECCIILDNAERLFTILPPPVPNTESDYLWQDIETLFAMKPYYNITIFMSIAAKDKALHNELLISNARRQYKSIALGGKMEDFDPCNVANVLNRDLKKASLPSGHGFIFRNGEATQIVTPWAEDEAISN